MNRLDMRLNREDIRALLLDNITIDLKLNLNSITKKYFINAHKFNLELAKEIRRLNLTCTNPKFITHFLILSIITRKYNVDSN